MATSVRGTEDYFHWFRALDGQDAEAVTHTLLMLEELGVTLGYPYSSAIKGWNPLRELRIQSGGRPLRVFYAFDPLRQAILLLGGDKTGEDRFYERLLPAAKRLWEQYLSAMGHERQEKGQREEVRKDKKKHR